MGARVNVRFELSNNSNSKELGKFILLSSDIDGNPIETTLNFDFYPLWEFSQDTSSAYFDVLLLGQIVYSTDRILNRLAFSDDGWCRNIELNDVPVVNADLFNLYRQEFNTALSYLTGDNWTVSFSQMPPIEYTPEIEHRYNADEYEYVSLFSGGLDSLIGFIDKASDLHAGKKVLLVSHYDMGKESMDQERIFHSCAANEFFNGKYTSIKAKIGMKNCIKERKVKYENTFRSRSFLFFAMGLYCAKRISATQEVIVPENGTISINIPLCKSRRSSCSTRTTHPVSMRLIMRALENVGINNALVNPYHFKSKADMMIDCAQDNSKRHILEVLSPLSCSCAKRSHNRWWDKDGEYIHANHVHHCGMCMPCIYRRVAMNAISLDNPAILGTDIFQPTRHFNINNLQSKTSLDVNLLLRFIRKINRQDVENELLAEGIDENEINQYVDLVMHSYQQISEWIFQKGNDVIKRKAGIL